jgi:putative hydrolase of the HAD superfamily
LQRWLIMIDLDDTLMPTNYRYHQAGMRAATIIQDALAHRSRRPIGVFELHRDIDRNLFKELHFQVSRFPSSWVETYEQLCREAGMPISEAVAKRIFNTAARFKYGPFRAYPGAKTALRKLRRQKHVLHLVTAGELDLQRRKLEQSGLIKYFDQGNFHVVTVEKRTLMAELANQYTLPAMMVGDSKRNDIAPAVALGLTAIWIPSETRHDGDTRVQPDLEMNSFNRLPEIIKDLKPKPR